jgi:drug/metabolite transporter (DMT)-like permease
MSSLFIFIFLSVFFPKTTKKLTLFNLMKFYVPDWKNNMNFENDNLNTNFYIIEGTTEKFNKTIHKISFLFMFLLYFSLCFYTKSYSNGILNHKKNKKIFIISLSFPLGLIMIVMILRRFFLFSKKFDKLSKISISFLILGIGFLSIFEIENFDHQHHHEIFFYSFFGGIFYGFYSTFLKYFSNIYGKNFNIEKILGYIGIYTFICCPFFLCLILWLNYNKNTIHMFEFGNNKFCYFLMFFINVVNYIIQIHCIISLSPFIFGFATFVSVLILFTIHVCLGNLKSDWFYFIGLLSILIGTFVGIFDKYLKQRKNNKLKK